MIGYNVSVKEYSLETGQAYSLLIKSSGVKEYAIVAPDFFDYIWLRKVEAGGLEIKANSLYEIEFEEEGEAELFFVPIRPGTYELYAKGLKDKGTRSEEHTSELQSLMRTSHAVFCLKKKKYQSNA